MYSVVIPVHNEEGNIIPLLHEIAHVLQNTIYEIVVVDDFSSDNTLAELIAEKTTLSSLRILKHPRCLGQSAGLRTGITHAKFPVVITLDGDGQNDPSDIPNLIEAFHQLPGEQGLVIGYRQKRRDAAFRTIASKIANFVRSRWLQDHTPDTGCGLKIFNRDIFIAWPYFNHIHRFFPALMRSCGYEVKVIPVNHRPRQRGVSHYGVWQRFKAGIIDLFGVHWLQKRYFPPLKSDEIA